ncbi:MAG: OmpH family outer membrane protein [Pseudomonadota bacterium]
MRWLTARSRALAGAFGLIAGLLLCPLLAHGQEAQGIGIIDAQRIYREATAVKSLQQQIDQQRDKFQRELREKEKVLRDADQELARQRAILSADAFNKRRKDLETQVSALQSEVRARKDRLDKAFAEGMKQVRAALIEVSREISEQKKLYLLIEKSSVVLVKPELEHTGEALKKLNERLPRVTLPAVQN